MQIAIDTPYVTVNEYARRSGQSDTAIRKQIERGGLLIRPKTEGDKSAVLINLVYTLLEAAEQAELVRSNGKKAKGAV